MTSDNFRSEAFGHVALQMDGVKNLSRALQTLLELEEDEPLEGDQTRAVANAITRAVEDVTSLFEAYYHPSADASQ